MHGTTGDREPTSDPEHQHPHDRDHDDSRGRLRHGRRIRDRARRVDPPRSDGDGERSR
jgi:hypothetical protein